MEGLTEPIILLANEILEKSSFGLFYSGFPSHNLCIWPVKILPQRNGPSINRYLKN